MWDAWLAVVWLGVVIGLARGRHFCAWCKYRSHHHTAPDMQIAIGRACLIDPGEDAGSAAIGAQTFDQELGDLMPCTLSSLRIFF